MKIRPVGAELFNADGLTDLTKLIVAFPNFAIAPKYLRSVHRSYLFVMYESQNKQRLFHYTKLVDWFL
jgi:hypothetical protein